MILWINGAFGAGKSETAGLLHKRIPDSHVYDPEQAGYFLWHVFPASMQRKGDFQEIPIWRSITYEVIRYLHEHFKGHLIIPMTLVNTGYYDEIVGRLDADGIHVWHCVLLASKPTLQKRLAGRGEPAGSWAEQQIDRCIYALRMMRADLKIETDQLSPEKVTDSIISASGLARMDP